jgi:acyl-CoA synthetase (AMP-forming)/AMP-acid ligase II
VPGIADACVLGITDELWGERVHAVLAVGEGSIDPESIRSAAEAACRAALSRYKVPKTWSIVAALPATAVGKVDKAALRALIGDGKKPLDLRTPQKANQEV